MEYSLTADDILKLEALNFYQNPNDKPMAGELATMEEMVSLGVNTVDPELEVRNVEPEITPVAANGAGGGAGGAGAGGAGAGAGVTGMNPQMQQLLELMKQQSEASMKPASQNYTADQKRMLAFAGIADAGRALQGKEGTAVAGLMTNFTDMADQKRKATNALAQRNMIGSMMGSMGNAATLNDPNQIRATIADLTNMLAVNPGLAPFINLQVSNLYKRLEEIETLEEGAASASTSLDLIDALLEQDLGQVAGVKGFFNSIFSEYGLAPKYTNINSLVDQLDGLNFLEIFVKLKGGGQITENETKQGKAAQSRIRSVLEGRGSEADIRAAIKEVQLYFDDAIKKNPTYEKAEKDTQDLRDKWLKPPNNG